MQGRVGNHTLSTRFGEWELTTLAWLSMVNIDKFENLSRFETHRDMQQGSVLAHMGISCQHWTDPVCTTELKCLLYEVLCYVVKKKEFETLGVYLLGKEFRQVSESECDLILPLMEDIYLYYDPHDDSSEDKGSTLSEYLIVHACTIDDDRVERVCNIVSKLFESFADVLCAIQGRYRTCTH